MSQARKVLNIRKVLESQSDIVHDEFHFFNADTRAVFFGAHLIDWLLANHNPAKLERKDMTKIVQDELYDPSLAHQVIYPVEHNLRFIDSEKHMYRLAPDQFNEYQANPLILNLHGLDTSSNKFIYELEDEHPTIQHIMEQLREIVGDIYKDFVEQDGTLVDYEALKDSQLFCNKYIPFVTKLAFTDISKIIGDDDLTKAFWINIFNVFAIHIQIAHYSLKKTFAMTVAEKLESLNTYLYNLGGHNYSLNDIHHSILRKNDPAGLSTAYDMFKSMFSSAKPQRFHEFDPRHKFVLRTFDPRVNFALNFGSISCPPLKYYDYENIENQLDHAAKRFCTKEVHIVETKGRRHIQLSQLFKDYQKDYGHTHVELFDYILNHCDDDEEKDELTKAKEHPDKAQIEFKKFNYDVNAKKHTDLETRLASVV